MKTIKYIFILSLIFLFSSCLDDKLNLEIDKGGYPELGENEYLLNLRLDDKGVRTRDVSFEENTALRVNRIWIGVFDIDNGNLIDYDDITLGYQTITAGVTARQFLHPTLVTPSEEDVAKNVNGYLMVCVGNFTDVKYTDIEGNRSDLATKLDHIQNWNDFISIAVDTESAYDGEHSGNVPMLAGFVYDDSKPTLSHIKIDQFLESTNGVDKPIGLSPQPLMSSLIMTVDDNKYYTVKRDETGKIVRSNGKLQPNSLITESSTIHLRRLVANIKVNIENKNNDLILEKVDYMTCNIPNAVYIIERRTTDCTIAEVNGNLQITEYGNFPSEADKSPNFSDLNPRKFYTSDKYTLSDKDWRSANTTGFTFQHFANKHWGNSDIFQRGADGKLNSELNQSIREKTNENGTFTALVGENGRVGENGEALDFNNYASYIVIRMHLIDRKTGRAADALYTIHEGNTSNELGDPENGGNLQDFIVARNIDYTYNVFINGFDDIYHNVFVGNGGGDYNHSIGQSGKVWELVYLNQDPDKTGYYDSDTGTFEHVLNRESHLFENAFTVKAGIPNIAFRIYAYTDPEECKKIDKDYQHFSTEDVIQGFNYNFEEISFSKLNYLWPPSSVEYSHYIQTLDKINDPQNTISLDQIPPDLKLGLKFLSADDEDYNKLTSEEDKKNYIKEKGESVDKFIVNFYQNIDDTYVKKEFTEDHSYHIFIDESNIDPKKKKYLDRNRYLRAVYIADRNGGYDEDGCTQLVKIIAGAQYPDNFSGQDFEIKKIQQENKDYVNSNEGTFDIFNGLNQTDFGDKANNGNGMLFTGTHDLAFRLVGYDGNTNDYYDYCYNFDLDDYPEFEKLWAAKRNDGNYTTISKNSLSSADIVSSLLDGFQIDNKDIKNFLFEYTAGTVPRQFSVTAYQKKAVNNLDRYKRALYVFDKNAFKTDYLESNEHRVHYQIYAIEQYPEVITPKPILFNKTLPPVSYTRYNIIDPLINFEIKVPLIDSYTDDNGFTLTDEDYTYKLMVEYGDFSSYGKREGNDIVFRIPQKALNFSGGNVTLQAIATSPNFADSEIRKLGSINLNEAPLWKSDQEDYKYLVDHIPSTKGKFEVTKNHLTLRNDNAEKIGIEKNGNFIRFATDAAYFIFKIYNSCTITATGPNNLATDDKRLGLKMTMTGNKTGKIGEKIDYFNSSQSLFFTISDKEFGDNEYIEIQLSRAAATGTTLESVKVSP